MKASAQKGLGQGKASCLLFAAEKSVAIFIQNYFQLVHKIIISSRWIAELPWMPGVMLLYALPWRL